MSKPDSDRGDAPPEAGATTETRIDAAHALTKAQTEPVAVREASVQQPGRAAAESQGSASSAQQLRVHAAQLAEYLRRRQRDLDHRESQLHAQIAQFENEARKTRLSFSRRTAELTERERELESRLADLAKAEAEKEARLLEQARQPGPDLARREEEVREAARSLEARQRQLDEREAAVAEADRLREQLTADRREVQEQARVERQRMAAAERGALADLEKKRQALARRNEQVDRSRAALEQLRSELGRMHRETLEIRLATEELWAQLSGSAPPAALTHSLGQVRAKLADHYRMANAELAERKRELETLRSQLAEEHQKLARQKKALDEWAARRQQEVEEQARRLVAREEELERQEAVSNDLARKWQAQQLGYQQEIRRLRAQLTQPDAALAPA